MNYGVLHVSHFALQAILRTEPAHQGRPAALLSRDTKKTLILQANSPARAAGIEAGLSAPQALARCSHLLLRTASAEAEKEARETLLACALDFSPTVEDTAPGVCTLDLRGVASAERVFRLQPALDQLARFGLEATAGLAATPLLALYAARHAQPLLAIENDKTFLGPLPVSVAEPSREIAEILQGWGIATLGQVTALSQVQLRRRLGPEGWAFGERAAGGDTRPLEAFVPPEDFHASMDFEHEVETLEALLFILRRFIDRLALQLRTAGFIAAELILTLVLADEKQHERSFRLPEPTGDETILFRTLHTYLESLHTATAIASVRLHILPTRPLTRQPGLFDSGLRDPHGFAETLARVVAIVGSGRVGTPQRVDTHRPDAFTVESPATTVTPRGPPAILPIAGLVLRRFRPPHGVRISLDREMPSFLSAGALHSPITAFRGPYRASGEWWKEESWEREEWDIELALGGLYRLVRERDEWYLDGEYD